MLSLFVIGIVLVLVAAVVLFVPSEVFGAVALKIGATAALGLFGVLAIVASTSLYVHADEGGIVTKKFGSPLLNGHIIAVNGERGVQAEVLSPGWSFGWWPFLYEVESIKNLSIPEGKVGIVTAQDGAPLPEGETYAPAWESPTMMIDAGKFMADKGCKGPQLTVLPPGQYRYNPKLYSIGPAECIDVKVGQVAVVRANAGKVSTDQTAVLVNGVPLVAKGCKGIWNEALTPGKYYMHPNAYQVIHVNTTKRVYSYTSPKGSEANTANKAEPEGDNSIHVRSSDSFQFPVDVRVAVAILAQNAPYVVAKIGDPDAKLAAGFDIMEEKCILPSLRAILRNSAEKKKALEYVSSRSQVESDGKDLFTADMVKDHIETEGFFLSDIGLNRTSEGQQLLKTQTDTELALQQQAQYKEQVKAEEQRASKVKAEEAANQQKRIQESLAGIEFDKNGAEAAKARATGEAAVYAAKVAALGGVDNFVKLEIAKLAVDALGKTWKGEVPGIVITGGGDGGSSMLTTWLAQTVQKQASAPAAPVAVPAAVPAAK